MATPEDRVKRVWANVTFGPKWEDRLSALMVEEIKDAMMQAITSETLPCGHSREALAGDGLTHWCRECEAEAQQKEE